MPRDIHALGHFDGALERYQRLRFLAGNSVDVRTKLSLQDQKIAETAGRQERRAASLPLDDRVGGHGGSVKQVRQLGKLSAKGL